MTGSLSYILHSLRRSSARRTGWWPPALDSRTAVRPPALLIDQAISNSSSTVTTEVSQRALISLLRPTAGRSARDRCPAPRSQKNFGPLLAHVGSGTRREWIREPPRPG